MSSPNSSDESTLIMPGQSAPDRVSLTQFGEAEIVWLRNPATGVIFKFFAGDARSPRDSDTIARCLKDGFTLSTEAAARAQAVELARLQGRALPEWANEPVVNSIAPTMSAADRQALEEQQVTEAHQRNTAARKAFDVKPTAR